MFAAPEYLKSKFSNVMKRGNQNPKAMEHRCLPLETEQILSGEETKIKISSSQRKTNASFIRSYGTLEEADMSQAQFFVVL